MDFGIDQESRELVHCRERKIALEAIKNLGSMKQSYRDYYRVFVLGDISESNSTQLQGCLSGFGCFCQIVKVSRLVFSEKYDFVGCVFI